MHALPCEAPSFINEQVVHNPAEPGTGLFDMNQIIEFAECFDEQFLKQVFSFRLAPCQSPRKTVQSIKVWPYDALEYLAVVGAGHNGAECSAHASASKDRIGTLRQQRQAWWPTKIIETVMNQAKLRGHTGPFQPRANTA